MVTTAANISDTGYISATGYTQDGRGLHAFLLTPTTAVPEPASLITLGIGIGIGGVGLMVLRRFRSGRD